MKTATLRTAELRNEVEFVYSQLNAIHAELVADPVALPIDTSQLHAALKRFGELVQSTNRRIQPEAVQGVKRLKWSFQKEEPAWIISEIGKSNRHLV